MTKRRQEPYRIFYDMLGFVPNDITLFQQACRHRSVGRNSHDNSNNERLEFLGDAVLSAIVSDIIFKTFNNKNEGFLSKTRSKIVQRETLNQVAIALGLDKIVEVTIHSQSHNNNTYGNALEALIGAIYLDQGFDECSKIVEEKIIKQHIDINKLSQQEVNFKSRLIEWCQHHHISYVFEIDDISADEHKNPIFHARIVVANKQLGQGQGYSKKEAQQIAAQEAMRYINKHKNLAATLLKEETQSPAL
ncbi:MAG: ribonuclease III [Bacteroidales bacterium]|nr:ribonuclease III [Bacteroidales bacterium]